MKRNILLVIFLLSFTFLKAQNNAEFVSQVVTSELVPGQSFTCNVTFRNTGTTTWLAENLYRLGTQAPRDNRIWLEEGNRVNLPHAVLPGEEVTFSANLTAPETEGVFVLQWRMVRDGVQWFGEKSDILSLRNISDSVAYYTYNLPASGNRYDEAMVAACLQGIMNRDSTNVYVLDPKDTHPQYWLDKMTLDNRWLSGKHKIELRCIEELFVLAKDKINGAVIWDTDVPASMNVATTIAGVEDLVVFSPEYAAVNLSQWGLSVEKDLRGMFTGVNTSSKKNDAYRWAIDEYLSKGLCSDHFLSLYEDPFLTRSKGDIGYVVTRDWAIKNRSFVYDLSPWGDEAPLDDPDQIVGTDLQTYILMLEEVFEQSAGEKMTEVTGFFSFKKYSNVAGHPSNHDPVPTEWETVYLISQYNCYQNTVASSCYNQSFHSHFEIADLKQNRPSNYLTYQNGNTYVCILMADYDSSTPLYDFLVNYWNDPKRGSIPLLWGINPNLIETYPDLVSYYYETQTPNDYFAADASAAGYMNPNRIQEEYLPLFVEHNKFFYEKLDMTISPMVLDWDKPTDAVKDAFVEFSPDGYATIVMDLHNTGGVSPRPHVWKGMPITNLINVVGQISNADEAANAMSSVIPSASQNIFPFYIFRIVWSSPSQVINAINSLKNKRNDLNIKVVDPYNFFSLFKNYTGVEDPKEEQFVSIDYNSTRNMLSVSPEYSVDRVEIWSVEGRVLETFDTNFGNIDVNRLKKGSLYVIRVFHDNGITTEKIVIN